jgi:hypothetical protein
LGRPAGGRKSNTYGRVTQTGFWALLCSHRREKSLIYSTDRGASSRVHVEHDGARAEAGGHSKLSRGGHLLLVGSEDAV